jgi:UDP-glucose 4-epimerase
MARILVLGGNGFIGRNLTVDLLKAGYEVTCADRVFPGQANRLLNSELLENRTGDLADASFIHSLFDSGGYDWVIHLACSLIASSGYVDFLRERELNVFGGYELIRNMRESGSGNILFFSTGGAIYGANGLSQNTEDSPLKPQNYYAYSKLVMEEYIRMESRTGGPKHIIVRPSNPYGAGQNIYGRQGLIAVTLGKLLKGDSPQIWGDGSVIRDYLHIQDLCRAIGLLLEKGGTNETYNIGSGKGYSVNDVMQMIEAATGDQFKVEYLPGRPVDVPVNVLDINKLTSHTGFHPSIELPEGISNLWNEMRVS